MVCGMPCRSSLLSSVRQASKATFSEQQGCRSWTRWQSNHFNWLGSPLSFPRSSRCQGVKGSLYSTQSNGQTGNKGSSPQPSYPSFSAGAASPTTPRICILGGGFGGLYTAVRLHALLWPQGHRPQVTLVDKGDRFVFKPLLYEVINGAAKMEEVAPTFIKLLSPYSVNFIQGSVQSISPFEVLEDGRSITGGRIMLKDGSAVEYDWLVLALGSDSNTFGIKGVREYANCFNTLQDTLQLLGAVERLERAPASAEVVVVGSGPAGVELATTMAERLGSKARVQLISTGTDILKGAPSTHKAAAAEILTKSNVTLVTNTLVKGIKKSNAVGPLGESRRSIDIERKDGTKAVLQADLVCWTAGSQPSSKAEKSMKLPFPSDSRGATRADETLRVVGHPRVFALGDIAGSSQQGRDLASLPATAQVAFQQADYVAWNLWAAINNRPLLPFKYQHLGDMMSLGRSNGAVTLPFSLPRELSSAIQSGPVGSILQLAGIRLSATDEKSGVTLDGPLGGLIRRAAYWYRQPTSEHRLEVGSSWVQQALQESTDALKKGSRSQ